MEDLDVEEDHGVDIRGLVPWDDGLTNIERRRGGRQGEVVWGNQWRIEGREGETFEEFGLRKQEEAKAERKRNRKEYRRKEREEKRRREAEEERERERVEREERERERSERKKKLWLGIW